MKQLVSSVYLTGRYRLNDQASDDIMVAKFHFPAPSSSWVTVYDGGGGDGRGLAIDAITMLDVPPAGATFIAVGGYRSENSSSNQELTLLYLDSAPLPELWWASNPDDHFGGLDNRVVSVAIADEKPPTPPNQRENWVRVYSTAVWKPQSGVGYGWRTRRYNSELEPISPPGTLMVRSAQDAWAGPINNDNPAAMVFVEHTDSPGQAEYYVMVTGWSTTATTAKDAFTIRYKDTAQ
jgi:hypothetical protein